MARPRKLVPTYRKHSQTGRAVVSIYRQDGSRTETVLPGKYGSAESKAEYQRLLSQLQGNEGFLPDQDDGSPNLTVSELVLKFMSHAKVYYVDPDGKPTSEIAALSAAVRPLIRMFGKSTARDFGPLALQTLRTAVVKGSWLTDDERAELAKAKRPIGLARSTTNKNTNRIKLIFKWAASVELLPESIHSALQTVSGLRRGRSTARETNPVKPISAAVIDDTLPHLPPIVRDMVEILLLTGMRCGELCIMRARNLDVSGDIWLYRPERHKGLWRDKVRVIAIGPKAREIVRKYLTMNTNDFLFRPAEQDEMIRAKKRASRKSKVTPSQTNRRKEKPTRRPGERFKVGAVNRAIRRACEREKIERWHVHQLRHSASLIFSREMGLESARAALGHSSVDMSAMYAGHDLEAAKKVAHRVG